MQGVAIVTGGSRGIGAAISRRLAAAGAKVYVASRDPAAGASIVEAIEAEGGWASWIRCDVTQEEQVEALFEESGALEQAGQGIRFLVNNAGNAPVGPIAEFSLQDFEACVALNLRAAFLCSRAFFRCASRTRGGSGGSIVNISSGAGKHGKSGWAAYCAAKSGLQGLARALADEGIAEGIRVNTVCPGGTKTALRASLFGEETEGSLLAPLEVADAVHFLLSEAASEIRGAELDVRKAR